MPRFFVENCPDPATDTLNLRDADFHHIRDVLRMKVGDELTVCDGARVDLQCRIAHFWPDSVELIVLDRSANQTEPGYFVTLFQGLPKGDKMELIIQKAVELGVSRIVPVICRRSVARVDERDTARKVERWNRIAAEAAKQCGRGRVPEVAAPLSFAAAALAAGQATIRLIPWEGERTCGLREELEQATHVGANPTISVMIGPEGGFDADEITAALAADIRPVTLGRRILRTETAGLTVLAMLIYRFNEF